MREGPGGMRGRVKTGRLNESLLGPQLPAPGWSHQSFCLPGQRGKNSLENWLGLKGSTPSNKELKKLMFGGVPQEYGGSPFNIKLPVKI